jgi:hypothetical protein
MFDLVLMAGTMQLRCQRGRKRRWRLLKVNKGANLRQCNAFNFYVLLVFADAKGSRIFP